MLDESMITMARRLDDTLAAQRTFVADASHQLRTPLTALRLRLENLQSRLNGLEEDELDAAIDETGRLSELVNDLLQLARADEQPPTAPFDLTQLALDRVDTWSAVAETRGITLQTRGTEGHAFVAAVPGAIEQILDNLLDNAVTAAPAGSVVTVEIAADTVSPTLDDHATRARASTPSRRRMPPAASGAATGPNRVPVSGSAWRSSAR